MHVCHCVNPIDRLLVEILNWPSLIYLIPLCSHQSINKVVVDWFERSITLLNI